MVIFEFESDDRFLGWSSTDIWSDRPCEGRWIGSLWNSARLVKTQSKNPFPRAGKFTSCFRPKLFCSRLVFKWLKSPTISRPQLEKRYSIVDKHCHKYSSILVKKEKFFVWLKYVILYWLLPIVSLAKMGSSAEGANTLGRSGGMLRQEVLKFSFSKMHIWRILRERINENLNRNLRWKLHVFSNKLIFISVQYSKGYIQIIGLQFFCLMVPSSSVAIPIAQVKCRCRNLSLFSCH